MKKFRNFQRNKESMSQRGLAPKKSSSSEVTLRSSIPKSWRVVVGHHSISEVIKVRPRSIKQVWLKSNWESVKELCAMEAEVRAHSIPILQKTEAQLSQLYPAHQGMALFVEGLPEWNIESVKNLSKSVLLVLDGIEDPHNLGAIVRTSWLMGVSGIILPTDRAVGLTPVVHKVSCGGVEHVPIVEISNFFNILDNLKEHGFWVFGLSHKSKKSLYELKIPEKVVWIIGSEEKGMRTTTEKHCDELISIPQSSVSASYNASVASGITLSETARQHFGRN